MYYLSLEGRQAGPFALEYLRQGWKDGSLPGDTLFWQEGLEDWQPLDSIKSLLEEAAPVAAAPGPMIIAGFWRRVSAFLVDVLLIGLVGFGSGYFLFDFFMGLGLAGILVGLAVATCYFGLLNSSLGGGQTFGKRLLGTRVVDATGNLIPIGRSILRYLILAFPFFLNKALVDGLVAPFWPGILAMLPVIAGFAAFTYLLVFNRHTRQLVHDLAVKTYVVRTTSPRPALAPRLWRGHAVVVGILCLVILLLSGAVPLLARMNFFQGMLAVRQAVMSTGEIRAASVTGGTTSVEEAGQFSSARILLILAHAKKPPVSGVAMAGRLAVLALQADPSIATYDRINVSISFGYDIGIASGTVTDQYSHTPDEWRQIARQTGTSP